MVNITDTVLKNKRYKIYNRHIHRYIVTVLLKAVKVNNKKVSIFLKKNEAKGFNIIIWTRGKFNWVLLSRESRFEYISPISFPGSDFKRSITSFLIRSYAITTWVCTLSLRKNQTWRRSYMWSRKIFILTNGEKVNCNTLTGFILIRYLLVIRPYSSLDGIAIIYNL